ncbi:hypothetical protein RF11_05746 [Thelohanellus kitauei]|uniref:Reverse transcriptase domain-containing protein n=1 Tax=Thelohanellus kitauei TaxID=669202 RepID=A0A0C2N3N5_THEKT|nr:hypothetical protein RF11_05746 [Thelohanellus kitauei]
MISFGNTSTKSMEEQSIIAAMLKTKIFPIMILYRYHSHKRYLHSQLVQIHIRYLSNNFPNIYQGKCVCIGDFISHHTKWVGSDLSYGRLLCLTNDNQIRFLQIFNAKSVPKKPVYPKIKYFGGKRLLPIPHCFNIISQKIYHRGSFSRRIPGLDHTSIALLPRYEHTKNELILNDLLSNIEAPGFDRIIPEFITHLGPTAKTLLTSFYNGITSDKKIPRIWLKSKIIAFPQPNKDQSSPHHAIDQYYNLSILFRLAGWISPKSFKNIANSITSKPTSKMASRAYEEVSNNDLISKLRSIIPPSLMEIVNVILRNRRFQVLRPYDNIFNIFLNDIPVTSSPEFIYADDNCSATQSHSLIFKETELKADLDSLIWLFDRCNAQIKPSKTRYASVLRIRKHCIVQLSARHVDRYQAKYNSKDNHGMIIICTNVLALNSFHHSSLPLKKEIRLLDNYQQHRYFQPPYKKRFYYPSHQMLEIETPHLAAHNFELFTP